MTQTMFIINVSISVFLYLHLFFIRAAIKIFVWASQDFLISK